MSSFRCQGKRKPDVMFGKAVMRPKLHPLRRNRNVALGMNSRKEDDRYSEEQDRRTSEDQSQRNRVITLELDIATFCIPNEGPNFSKAPPAVTTVDDLCVTATDPSLFAVVEHMAPSRRASLLSYISDSLTSHHHHSRRLTQESPQKACKLLEHMLARGLDMMDAGVQCSALVAYFEPDYYFHVAWAGASGCLVLRDRDVIFRSYSAQNPYQALEDLYNESGASTSNDEQSSVSEFASTESNNCHWESSTLDGCVKSTVLQIQEGDLIIAGTQALFSNLSERQILSFLRPVPDANDATLAVANATCLGSFRTDDVSFISYYLAHLADNYATSLQARPLLPFPFPPSPFLDHVLVVAASCSSAT